MKLLPFSVKLLNKLKRKKHFINIVVIIGAARNVNVHPSCTDIILCMWRERNWEDFLKLAVAPFNVYRLGPELHPGLPIGRPDGTKPKIQKEWH
ncbi:MAG: hypothetical protein C0490_28890 [Marivirga sp.]|nr:hypothetical protein [Marivirga sp.]